MQIVQTLWSHSLCKNNVTPTAERPWTRRFWALGSCFISGKEHPSKRSLRGGALLQEKRMGCPRSIPSLTLVPSWDILVIRSMLLGELLPYLVWVSLSVKWGDFPFLRKLWKRRSHVMWRRHSMHAQWIFIRFIIVTMVVHFLKPGSLKY